MKRPDLIPLKRKYYTLETIGHYLVNQFLPLPKRKNPSTVSPSTQTRSSQKSPPTLLPDPFTLTTWNIQMGYQLPRLKIDLPTVKGDLVLLQEVPIPTPKEPPLFSNTDIHFAYAPHLFIHHPSTRYPFIQRGQMTLSRQIPTQTEIILLPRVSSFHPPQEQALQHVALYTQFKTKKGSFGIYNLHLDCYSRPRGRKLQFEKILEHIRSTKNKYVIVAGDFNTFLGRVELALLTHKAGLRRAKTGGTLKFLKLDHILYTNNLKIEAKVVRKRSSDHSPIVAKVKIV